MDGSRHHEFLAMAHSDISGGGKPNAAVCEALILNIMMALSQVASP